MSIGEKFIKFSSLLKNNASKTMYGYGYRYPKVRVNYEKLYSDPEYQYNWAKAAILNKGVAARSPWIAFLKKNHYLDQVGEILRKAGEEYRSLYGVSDKAKTAARRRKTKIERALAAVRNPDIQRHLAQEYGNKFSNDYVNAAISSLQSELDHIRTLLEWEGPTVPTRPPGYVEPVVQQQQEQQQLQPAKGYGLRSGLGYGYFY
jgi:hypothetical protein